MNRKPLTASKDSIKASMYMFRIYLLFIFCVIFYISRDVNS